MLPTPTIPTDRLVLRGWHAADHAQFAALNADPEVMRFIGAGGPLTTAQSDDLLAQIEAHWAQHGFGLWCAAAREAPQTCLGFVGLAIPGFLPAVLPAVEVGWRLARHAWGHGLATEAARAALRHAFTALQLASVVSIVQPANERSLRVVDKLGLRHDRDVLHPVTRRRVGVYAISAEDAGFSPHVG
jgi:RimJ/RimL family protein N-acetyltransferase